MKTDANIQIQKHIDEARNIGLKHIERLTISILNKNKSLFQLRMGMGSVFFDCPKNVALYGIMNLDERASFKQLSDFIAEWDEVLKFSGERIRITRDGIADWK